MNIEKTDDLDLREVLLMNIKKTEDLDLRNEIETKLKLNDGYCPCRVTKTLDTKCMCKEFRDMITRGDTGECHCGLYIVY